MILVSHFTRFRVIGMYLTIAFIVLALTGLLHRGLNLGIDFTGGFITEFSTSESIDQSNLQQILVSKIHGQFILTSADDKTNWTVRQPEAGERALDKPIVESRSWLNELKHDQFFQNNNIQLQVLDSDYIGSQIGKELVDQGGLAMLTAFIIILLYLTARFEWRFALGAILALIHDIVFVLGIFAWLQLEFNLTVLASLLAIIGYSLNDSIIVADRVRELMRQRLEQSFKKGSEQASAQESKQSSKLALSNVVNLAIASTLTRTLITSGTTLATISAIWWLAGAPLAGFSVALFAGILVGTFSSICISATFPQVVGLNFSHYRLNNELNEK